MKNKKSLLLSIVSLGMLVACGGNTSSVAGSADATSSTETSTSSVAASTEDTSSVTSAYDEDASSKEESSQEASSSVEESSQKASSSVAPANLDITDVIDAFAEYKAKVVIEDFAIYNLFGASAFEILSFDETANAYVFDGGYLELTDNGVWEYAYDTNNKPVIVDCVFAGNTDDSFVDAGMSFYEAAATIGADTYADKWEEDDDGFITDDEDTIAAVCTLAGYGTYAEYGYVPEYITVTTDDTSATFEGQITIGTKTVDVTFTAENLGTNANADVAALIANPTLPTFTAFTTEQKADMTAIIGEVIPFSNKFTAYSAFATDDDDMDGTDDIFYFDDYKAGNIIDDYATLLTGWTAGEKETDADLGVVSQEFRKQLTAATDTKGATGYSVTLQFHPKTYFEAYDAYYGTNEAAFYPYGIFSVIGAAYEDEVVYDTVEKINKLLATVDKTDGTDAVPALNFGTLTPTKIDLSDLTDLAIAYGAAEVCYYSIRGNFDTDANAVAAIKTWVTDLTTAGYANVDTTATGTAAETWETEKTITLLLNDSAFTDGMMVSINLGEFDSDTKTYVPGTGAFSIMILA